MQQHQVKTVFYKYKKSPGIKLILYLLFLLGFFFVARGNTFLMVLWFATLILPPIVVAVRQRSIFTLRSWDERSLTITADFVQVGEEKFEFKDIQTVAIYLGGFRNLPMALRRRRKSIPTSEGDDNVLAFRHNGVTRSYEFFLRDFDSYVELCHIIDVWKNSGKSFVLKEQYSREYIRKQLSN